MSAGPPNSLAPDRDAAPLLAGKVVVMSGGSRGIGLAIALRAARDGAKVAIGRGELQTDLFL
jgi:NAD(P)-dependent dehydrogenase (short-subunit alcohol dehydrogenase family)